MLKEYLQVSTGDLHAAANRMRLAIENQHKNISSMISSEQLRIPHDLRLPIFSRLVNKISHFALKKMRNEFDKVSRATQTSPLPACTGTFRTTMGLPCAHMIQQRLEEKAALTLQDVHPHWWIVGREEPVPLVQVREGEEELMQQKWDNLGAQIGSLPVSQRGALLQNFSETIQAQIRGIQNPVVGKRTKGRPRGAGNRTTSSTQREPSQFEIVERALKASRCGLCNEAGHNRRTCKNGVSARRCGLCNEAGHNRRTCKN